MHSDQLGRVENKVTHLLINKRGKLNQSWFNVDSPSTTLAHHLTNIGTMSFFLGGQSFVWE